MPSSGGGTGSLVSVLFGPGASLDDLITELLERTSSGVESITSADGDTDSLVDETLQDSYEPSTSYENSYIRFLDTPFIDQLRRTGNYERSNGQLDLSRPLATGIASGVRYQYSELLDFNGLKKCINLSLEASFFRDIAEVTGTGERQMLLPSWILERGQVISVEAREGSTNNYRYFDLNHWSWLEDAGSTPGEVDQSLMINVNPPLAASQTLIIKAMRPFPELTASDQRVSMNKTWLMAGAKFHFYDLLVQRGGKSDVSRYKDLRKTYRAEWLSQQMWRLPSDPTDIQFSRPFGEVQSASVWPNWSSA